MFIIMMIIGARLHFSSLNFKKNSRLCILLILVVPGLRPPKYLGKSLQQWSCSHKDEDQDSETGSGGEIILRVTERQGER